MVCSKCGARVIVAVHELGADRQTLVLDAEPTPDGSIWLPEAGRARPVANDYRAGAERYSPHPLTCADRRAG